MKSLGILKKTPKTIGFLGGSLLLLSAVFSGGITAVLTSAHRQLPDSVTIQDFQPEALPTQILNLEGQKQGEISDGNSCYSQQGSLEDLKTFGKYAIASEDPNFTSHPGIDLNAVVRAGVANLREGEVVEGGSTIDIQLAQKMLERTTTFYKDQDKWQQKSWEFLLALKINRYLTKEEILNKYLAIVPGPNNNCGVFAIAYEIFGKKVKDLDQNEILTLVSLFPAPQAFFDNPSTLLERRNLLIARILKRENSFGVTRLFSDQALVDINRVKNWPLPTFTNPSVKVSNNWATDAVKIELEQRFGEKIKSEGYEVTTTIIPNFQQALEEVTTDYQKQLPPKTKIATTIYSVNYNIVALNNTGENTTDNSFNVAYLGETPFGSSFKTLVYLDYVLNRYKHGRDLDSLCFGPNYLFDYGDQLFRCGSVTSYFAKSDNPAAIGAYDKNSLEKFYLKSFNSVLHLGPGDASALGTDDISHNQIALAYIAIANGGYTLENQEPLITTLATVKDKTGKIVYSNEAKKVRIIPEAVVIKMQENLREVVTSGTGIPAFTDGVLGGKSGTTCYGLQSCAAIFISLVEIENKTYVIITRIFNDDGYDVGYGGSVTGTFNARVIEKIKRR